MTERFDRFDSVSAVTPSAESPLQFAASIPDGWQQGRGAFGGLVMGILTRAVERAESDRERVIRSCSFDLCGPAVPGPATVAITELRRGAKQSNYRAELLQNGDVLASGLAVLSVPRLKETTKRLFPGPKPPPWQETPVIPVAPPLGPVFAQHVEYRSSGPLPYSGSAVNDPYPWAEGYVRFKTALSHLDAPAIVALLDAWWPALFSIQTTLRPIATISFTAEILCDPNDLDPAEPLTFASKVVAIHDGFFVEFRELWKGEHQVALNQQTMVIVK